MSCASASLLVALDEALAGRNVLLLGGATSDWFLDPESGAFERLAQFVALWAQRRGLQFVCYRRTAPAEQLVPDGAHRAALMLVNDDDPVHAVPHLIDLVTAEDSHVVVLVEGLENLLPDTQVPMSSPQDLDLLDRLQRVPKSDGYSFGRSLLVLAEHVAAVHQRVRVSPGITVFDIALPDGDERSRFASVLHQEDPEAADAAAQASAGLTLDELRYLLRTAQVHHQPAVARVRELKAGLLRIACPNLELLPVSEGLDRLAGLGRLEREVRIAMASGRFPSTVLLVGPPGTGKTAAAMAAGATASRPVMRLHMMNSPYIGENERMMREVRQRLDTMGDVIVWIDELDVNVTSRGSAGTDSATSQRVTAGFMEWLGDSRPRGVSVFAATNRPDRLDNAMTNRMMLVVPLLQASQQCLPALFLSVARQAEIEFDQRIDLHSIAALPGVRAVSGRDVHGILQTAFRVAFEDGRTEIRTSDLRHVVERLGDRVNEQDHYWTLLALRYTRDQSLFPWAGEPSVDESTLPFHAQPYVNADGTLRSELVDRTIREFAGRYG